jgi:polyphosphate kinase 2
MAGKNSKGDKPPKTAVGSPPGPLKPKMPRKQFDKELQKLQLECVQMLDWVRESGHRLVVIFEGRDAAGKGGTIKRLTAPMNPRACRVVALAAPTERERGQWYFQRYVEELPTAGEMVVFDRSWYNRAGVERVMGFCTDAEYWDFLHSVPEFERMLLRSGIQLVKYWFSVSDDEQERRFQSRIDDPARRWKLSPMDLEARTRWVEYSKAKDLMVEHTSTAQSPWWEVAADDKRRARLNTISHLLSLVDYREVRQPKVKLPPRKGDQGYRRPPIEELNWIPTPY